MLIVLSLAGIGPVTVRAQRRHASKAKGGKNHAKARLKVARLHALIADKRRDFQHKFPTRIIRENQTVCVEALAVKTC